MRAIIQHGDTSDGRRSKIYSYRRKGIGPRNTAKQPASADVHRGLSASSLCVEGGGRTAPAGLRTMVVPARDAAATNRYVSMKGFTNGRY